MSALVERIVDSVLRALFYLFEDAHVASEKEER